MQIPILSILVKFTKIYYRYAGWMLPIVFVLYFLCGFAEIIGFSMFLPLLSATSNNPKDPFSQSVNNLLQNCGITPNITVILLIIIICFLIKALFTYLQFYLQIKIKISLIKKLQLAMIKHYSEMSYSYYLNTNIGYLTEVLLVNAPTAISQLNRLCIAIVSLVYISIYLSAALFVNAKMTFICIMFGSIMLYTMRNFHQLIYSYSKLEAEERISLTSILVQFISGFKFIKATNSFKPIYEKLNKSVFAIQNLSLKSGKLNAFSMALKEPLNISFVCLIVFFQVVVLHKKIEVVILLFIFIYKTIGRILAFQNEWQSFKGQLGTVNIFLNAEAQIIKQKEAVGGKKVVALKSCIELKNVSFRFKDNLVLNNINLHIEKNTTIGIVGTSGAGKTTIFDLFVGLLAPESGEILIDGQNYNELDIYTLRHLFGYVTQEPVLFNDTIKNNVTLWQASGPAYDEKYLLSVLNRAHCTEFINQRKCGLETIIGDKGIQLSGGQKQRLAIARELYRKPAIMLFDEATSSLDSESEQMIQDSIDQLKGNQTTIIIAHRLSTLKKCDILYVLAKGEIIEEGSFTTLFANQHSVFHNMCKKQNLQI